MKKLLSLLFVVLGIQVSTYAQDDFYPGFQWSLKGGAGYTIGETSIVSKLLSPSVSADFGWQFSPLFTLRADVSGWEGKGVFSSTDYRNPYSWSVQFAQLAVDGKFDIINMFTNQYRFRVVNPYVFIGLGAQYRFNNTATKSCLPEDNYLDEFKKFSYVGRIGAGVDFRVSRSLAIVLEYAENATDDSFNSKRGDYFDHQMYLQLGLNFTFGQACKARSAERAVAEANAAAAAKSVVAEKPVAEKPVAEESKPAAEPVADAAKVTAEPAVSPAEVEAALMNEENRIYFQIGKSVYGEKEAAKIERVVNLLKTNPDAKVTICGFADKETGTRKINWELSEKRAKNVCAAIQAGGIDPSRIDTSWYGDTRSVDVSPELNRVVVTVIK